MTTRALRWARLQVPHFYVKPDDATPLAGVSDSGRLWISSMHREALGQEEIERFHKWIYEQFIEEVT